MSVETFYLMRREEPRPASLSELSVVELLGAVENDEDCQRGTDAVRDYTSATPIGTILVALGAGYLLGCLIHIRD